MKPIMEGKYIRFVRVDQKLKTKVWAVFLKPMNSPSLGMIKWFPAWRRYSFFPWVNTIWDQNCLGNIMEFLEAVNAEHQQALKRKRK